MNRILEDRHDFESLNSTNSDKPNSYPCLAVRHWESYACSRDGYHYEFISLRKTKDGYMIDEDRLNSYNEL